MLQPSNPQLLEALFSFQIRYLTYDVANLSTDREFSLTANAAGFSATRDSYAVA